MSYHLFARNQRHILAEWWWTVDRRVLFFLAALMLLGVAMSFAASPAVAHRIELATYHFTQKQFIFMLMAIFVSFVISLLPPRQIFHLAVLVMVFCFIGLVATLLVGFSAKGATRWLYIGGVSVQPSEFLKPGLVVVLAILFANRHQELRNFVVSVGLIAAASALLIAQPDIGQMILISSLWGYLYLIAGGRLSILSGLVVVGLVTGILLYASLEHFANRVDRFLDPSSGDNYQTYHAVEAMRVGGVTGVGLGSGKVKARIPDAHTDYVFVVAVEEGGFIAGGLIILLFGMLGFHVLRRLEHEPEHRIQLAAAGLTALIVVQAGINLAVNLNLVPAKGMTLPFISYGGSSLIAVAVTMGMLLGLTRRRRFADKGFAGKTMLDTLAPSKRGGMKIWD